MQKRRGRNGCGDIEGRNRKFSFFGNNIILVIGIFFLSTSSNFDRSSRRYIALFPARLNRQKALALSARRHSPRWRERERKQKKEGKKLCVAGEKRDLSSSIRFPAGFGFLFFSIVDVLITEFLISERRRWLGADEAFASLSILKKERRSNFFPPHFVLYIYCIQKAGGSILIQLLDFFSFVRNDSFIRRCEKKFSQL